MSNPTLDAAIAQMRAGAQQRDSRSVMTLDDDGNALIYIGVDEIYYATLLESARGVILESREVSAAVGITPGEVPSQTVTDVIGKRGGHAAD